MEEAEDVTEEEEEEEEKMCLRVGVSEGKRLEEI